MEIADSLRALQDPEYRAFTAKLLPTVAPERILGVRTPALRTLAKRLKGTSEAQHFLQTLPHRYYEEDNLHAALLEMIPSVSDCLAAVDAFLPFVDNWATCDMLSPKVFFKHRQELAAHLPRWLKAEQTYTIRFGIGMLQRHFLDEAFDPRYPEMVASLSSQEYYVNMMRAWYFATALAKQPQTALEYLTQNRLDVWTHNKTIRKALESYRITQEQKNLLVSLRRK